MKQIIEQIQSAFGTYIVAPLIAIALVAFLAAIVALYILAWRWFFHCARVALFGYTKDEILCMDWRERGGRADNAMMGAALLFFLTLATNGALEVLKAFLPS